MKKLRLIAIWVLFSSIAAQCSCHGQSLSTDDEDERFEKSLRAEIRLTQTEVRNKETFTVSTAIYNTSETEQTVAIRTCEFPNQWRADNAAVLVNLVDDCDWNKFSRIRLKPGESFQRLLSVHIELPSDPIDRIEMSFRLGFRNADPSRSVKPDVKSPTLWSNTVTMSVLGKS
jgi:hypothetical protein